MCAVTFSVNSTKKYVLTYSSYLYKKIVAAGDSSDRSGLTQESVMSGRNRTYMSATVLALVFFCWAVISTSASLNARCKLKRHPHRAMQTDLNGRRCWDDIKILSCWGYCLSYEISDWQFPYKQSHHPVCVHGERKHASVKLRHCDPGVMPGTDIFHYVEATSCKCQVCSSDDTSCEWLPPDTSLLDGLILKEELEEELEQNTI